MRTGQARTLFGTRPFTMVAAEDQSGIEDALPAVFAERSGYIFAVRRGNCVRHEPGEIRDTVFDRNIRQVLAEAHPLAMT